MARLGTIADGPLERLVLAAGRGPTPLMDTIVALLLARTLMAATKLDLFEALAAGPLPAEAVAARCETDPGATRQVLDTLVACRYLRLIEGRYALAPPARRWLLRASPRSLRDATLHRYLDLWVLEHLEEYLRSGRALAIHDNLSDERWELYQRGQRSHALPVAAEVVTRLRLPPRPRAMLDLGGGHGHFAATFCRRYVGLRATVLDLPAALERAAPLIADEGLGDRLAQRAGDARAADLGDGAYDLVFMANLAHHLDAATNRDIQRRAARALRPGGVSAILELTRAPSPQAAGQVGALTGLYFALQSEGGSTWSDEEMADWQRAAGLAPRRPLRLRLTPGYGVQAAVKGDEGMRGRDGATTRPDHRRPSPACALQSPDHRPPLLAGEGRRGRGEA